MSCSVYVFCEKKGTSKPIISTAVLKLGLWKLVFLICKVSVHPCILMLLT